MTETPHAGRQRRPTIADVAERAGVSKGLVSFALNDRPGVNVATRERILTVAAEMGWSPDLRARSLSTNRSFALGLVLQRDTAIVAGDPFFPAFIAGVERELSAAGPGARAGIRAAGSARGRHVSQARVGAAGRRRLPRRPSRGRRAARRWWHSLGLAAVTLGHADIDSPFPAVTVDDVDGMIATVDHLADLGHRSPRARGRLVVHAPRAPTRGRVHGGLCEARGRGPSRPDRLQCAARGRGDLRA